MTHPPRDATPTGSAQPSGDDPRPEPPEAPDNNMCCGRGCVPCIYDYYEEALERYRIRLREWEARHAPP
jgi:hypothetical protein